MRLSQLLSLLVVICCLPLVGCGGSNETTTISPNELGQYVETHADEIAEDAKIEADEEAEEEAEESEE